MMRLPTIEDAGKLEGKRVLVRFDLNAAVAHGTVVDSFRLDKAISTFDLLRQKKAKVIALSHISVGKGYDSLRPMLDYLNGFFPIKFCPTYFTKEADSMVAELKDDEVLLFENIRMNAGEDENDMEFAKKLAQYGDIFVNEAFSESHRKQASIVLLPTLLPHYAGPLFLEEVENLSKCFSPSHPFLFILGGAKFQTKLPLIQKFLRSADTIFVGGALANDIFKARGFEVGTSLVSNNKNGTNFNIGELLTSKKFTYPIDVTVKKPDGSIEFRDADKFVIDEYIGDVGPQTIEKLKEVADKAKFILWNGPLGNYELGFKDKTEQLADILSHTGAETIIGGGDTLAAIQSLNILEKFSFASTAGGAMLDFLAHETLPGIEVLLE